jgi:glycerophosphoryl diester phosphodiesterase
MNVEPRNRVLVFGHGSDQPGNELNSAASFLVVRQSGADGVELDVRRTADDQLVAIHDHTLPDGTAVAAAHSSQLPTDVPALAEVLDLCAGMLVNIEIKNYPSDPAFDPSERVTDLVVDLLHQRRFTDTVIVSSFGMACIDRVLKRAPALLTAALVLSRRPPEQVLDPVAAHGHRIVNPYDTMVDAAFMAAARSRSLQVNVWLGDDESVERLEELVALGVDGIITAEPERALSVVARHR